MDKTEDPFIMLLMETLLNNLFDRDIAQARFKTRFTLQMSKQQFLGWQQSHMSFLLLNTIGW